MHYFTSEQHRLDLCYDINYFRITLSEIEKEADSISQGVSYMVNDFTSADSIAMANRMDDTLYMEALQKLSHRIRACAIKINEVTMTLAHNVIDPSAQTQIMWDEITYQITDLTHSLEVSYNNLRLIYLYIKGEVHIPETHTMPLLIIPYMDFTEDELPEDKINEPEKLSGDDDSNDSSDNADDNSDDENDSEDEAESDDKSEDPTTEPVKAEYPKISIPVSKEIVNDIESKYPAIDTQPGVKTHFDKKDIEEIIADRMEAMKGRDETAPESSEEKIDRNTWVIGGVVVDAKYLPVKTDDPKETWIVWPNYESDLESEFEFVRYDQEAQKWVTVQSDENVGLTSDDVALYVHASNEAGCFGKVSKYEYLPKYGRIHSMIYCEENDAYYKYDLDTLEASKENPKPKLGFGWFVGPEYPEESSSDVTPNT